MKVEYKEEGSSKVRYYLPQKMLYTSQQLSFSLTVNLYNTVNHTRQVGYGSKKIINIHYAIRLKRVPIPQIVEVRFLNFAFMIKVLANSTEIYKK